MSAEIELRGPSIRGPLSGASPDEPMPEATDLNPQDVLAVCSRSFHFASRFLPAESRPDVALLYAFCRHVDDVADEPEAAEGPTPAEALERLDRELDGHAPSRPLVAALRALAARRGLDLEVAHALIEGVRSDIGAVIVADDAGLLRYAYRVASTVGLMMCPLLGVRDPRALPFAIDLGIAMQLTNICRDVAEDAHRGRVYLPRSRLEPAGLSPEALLGGEPVDRAALARVVLGVLGLADDYYRSAELGMHFIPLRARAAILVAGRVYRAIGVKLRAHGADVLAGRTVVGGGGKVVAALSALLQLLRPSSWGLGAGPHQVGLHRSLVGLPSVSVARTLER